MGFKIGDRVLARIGEDEVFEGQVTELGTGPGGPWCEVRHDSGYTCSWFAYLLELTPTPRGPKPLTLTGGKVRMTVRQGWTTKCPSGIYQLGRYNR